MSFTKNEKEATFKLKDILEEKDIKLLYQVKENSMKLHEMLKGMNETKLAKACDNADEDMTPEIGKKMGRPDLGKYGRKGWEKELKHEDMMLNPQDKDGNVDLKKVDKDSQGDGPLRRWAEPTKLTNAIKEAEDMVKDSEEDEGCKEENIENFGDKKAEPFTKADGGDKSKDEDMTPEIGKKMKRPDLGKYGRDGWEKEVHASGEKTEKLDKVLADAEKKLKRMDGWKK